MALSFSQFPFCPSKLPSPKTAAPKTIPNRTVFASKPLNFTRITKASPEEKSSVTADDGDEKSTADLGAEIKRAMKERDGDEKAGFLSGVAEEIREIEWPAFGKVLGTTGVVMGVIAGSSVVLLTVNAVLAEISDRVFAGKGVQDFFG